MEGVSKFWNNNCESLLQDFTLEQKERRAKQRMLKDDWEKFKEQQRDLMLVDRDNKEPGCVS